MPLDNVGPIFQGLAPPGERKALKTYITKNGNKFDRFLFPCVGLFALPENFAECGVKPKQMVCSDISLHSSTLGYLLDPTKKVADLGFSAKSEETKQLIQGLPQDDDVGLAACICMVQKYAQLKSQSEFIRWQRLQMIDSKHELHEKYSKGLAELKEKLGGLTYEIRDAHEHIKSVTDDLKTFIWYNPPGYKGGYTKMYEPYGHYEWTAEPNIPEIIVKEVTAFLQSLEEVPATVAINYEEPYDLYVAKSPKWHKLYVEPYGTKRRLIYVLMNKPTGMAFLSRSPIKDPPVKIPKVFDDHEITVDSKMSMVKTDKHTALYFYDLFVKELGMTKAQEYYLFCIDGQVVGTCGFDTRELMVKRRSVLYETFGLTVTSLRYQRINRLLMRYITGKEFIDQFTREKLPDQLFLSPIAALQTTCLSKYPEVKTNRGILKLIEREPLKDHSGKFRLVYKAKIHDMTQKEILEEWLNKHAKYSAKEYKAA